MGYPGVTPESIPPTSPESTCPLSHLALRRAKPGDKPHKLSDGGGLYSLLQPTGARYWRWKYQIAGKEKLLALGIYPDVPLALARQRREGARQLLARGVDPRSARRPRRLPAPSWAPIPSR